MNKGIWIDRENPEYAPTSKKTASHKSHIHVGERVDNNVYKSNIEKYDNLTLYCDKRYDD